MALTMASSPSSSDNEFDLEEYDGIRRGLPLPKDYPFFPILQTPQLVYYAKVQQNLNQGTGETPRKKPNCFSKAFKWYTKERHCPINNSERPSKSEDKSAPPDDVVGFASWLDTKYAEFLRDSGVEPDYSQQTTQTAPGQLSTLNCKPLGRKTAGNSSEAGDSIRESFDFILQPKEQECFANQGTCCHKSNITLNSLVTPSSKTTKTQSASSICQAPVANNETDAKPKKNKKLKKHINRGVSGPKFVPEKRKCSLVDAECECDDLIPTKTSSPSPNDSKNNNKNSKDDRDSEKNKLSIADATCECVDLVPTKLTAEDCKCGCKYSQIDSEKLPDVSTTVNGECQTDHHERVLQPAVAMPCDRNSKGYDKKSIPDVCICSDKPVVDQSCQTDVQSFSSIHTCCPCDVFAPVKQSMFIEQYGTKTLATRDCQTLPNPINLDAIREYPLFMKILCADKFARARVY